MSHLKLVPDLPAAESKRSECRVTVRLIYTNGDKRTPYKWTCRCACGWGGMSWSWSREYECYTYPYANGPDPAQWMEDNGGEPEGGAFVMALEHVGLAPKQVWVPLFGAPS